MPIKIKDAKNLEIGTILYSNEFYNSDKPPRRFKVSGVVQTRKRDPLFLRVPLKHGLYTYAYLINTIRAPVIGKMNFHLDEFELDEEKAIAAMSKICNICGNLFIKECPRCDTSFDSTGRDLKIGIAPNGKVINPGKAYLSGLITHKEMAKAVLTWEKDHKIVMK